MYKFFINRPIVAMVIAIITVIIGLVTLFGLPIAQFPKIIPPEIFIQANYVGADAQTIEQAVATPIEQQMSGVDNMNYMYSINANNGLMRMYVNFDVQTDPNIDHMLTQLRYAQAESQLPADVRNFGVTVQKSLSSPFLFIAVFSPNGTHDAQFLANYAYINLNDALTRVPGIAQAIVFGAGQYAMRLWVKPAQLATLNITVPEIISAVNNQNTVNPAGRIGGRPVPPGQEFTYSVLAQGRLTTPEQFGNVIVREAPNGGIVRVKDVARIELGAQDYSIVSRLNGKNAAIVAVYQLPGSNAVQAAAGVRKLMSQMKQRFPSDMDYTISLDQTSAVTEGMKEIVETLVIAILLVVAALGWFAIGFIYVLQAFLLRRYDLTAENNFRARRFHTQFQLFRRVLIAFVVIVDIGTLLWTFNDPRIWHYGSGLLASAGIASLIIATAAKSTASNFFAGLQIVPPYEGADPELTYVGLWGAEDPEAADDDGSRLAYAAVARKP